MTMQNKLSYTKEDVSLCKTYLQVATKTYQLSEEGYKGIIETLNLVLDKKLKQDKENYLTIKETCQKLKISKPTIYSLIHSGKLQKIKVGRSTRILESNVLRAFGGVK